MSAVKKSNAVLLFAFVVISVAVVGYFTGLRSPISSSLSSSPLRADQERTKPFTQVDDGVLPATRYSEMAAVTHERSAITKLASLKSTFDPLEQIKISQQDKLAALHHREQNRAFNGAPPTIPHPIEQRSDIACVACHTEGIKTKTLRIPRMSHAYLANCTQCHVESNPRHMAAITFRENEFAGLPAPLEGPRAFRGAPPQIPHTTWMRSDCMSCHGYAGRQGIRTTHPWRNNCQQCHAPSASMDQTLLPLSPQFLPGPKIQK